MTGARRAPIIALAVVALFAGLWGGLLLLGIDVHAGDARLAEAHGPLMALGFLGTLISLERAVALRRSWAYVAPVAAGSGALLALSDAPGALGQALLLLGGCVLLAAHVALDRMQRSLHNAVMGLGALAWCAAAVWWLSGANIARFVPLLAAFLVLTIVGERLELARLGGMAGLVPRLWLGSAVAALAVGLALSLPAQRLGVRVAGAGLVAQALWLARYDIARRTVRMSGVTRFMALALLAGYVWLAVGGVLWIAGDPAAAGGFGYDAALHAIFLGFVFSMVFAHAPVIVPAVLRVPLPYHPRFYAHLVLLHASLALRLLGGDLAHNITAWRWGGVLGEVAILLFLASSAYAVLRARRRARQPHHGDKAMQPIDPFTTLGALVAERPARAQLFERLRLDYCCGGAHTLAEACTNRGLDPETVARLLEALDTAPPDRARPLEDMDWRKASVGELCQHIVRVHHEGLRRDLPRIAELAATVERVHGRGHGELRDLARLFAGMRSDLERHLELEERRLFPACVALERGGEPLDDGVLMLLEDDHADTGDALVAMRELAADYDTSRAMCGTHRALLDALRRLELDLHQHVHEENNILFPRVRALAAAATPTGGNHGRA